MEGAVGKVRMGATLKVSHERLVACAKQWLKNSKQCRVVATELRSAVFEEPDAIGWSSYGHSVLVECKASRSDFFADAKKSRAGLGREKWYLTPPKLVSPEEVPPGWGLIEYRPSNHPSGHFVKVVVSPPKLTYESEEERAIVRSIRLQNEMLMLISIAARSLEALAMVGRLGVGEGEGDV
jgi:hypothetical protein